MTSESSEHFAAAPDPARTHATLRFAFGITVALIACELLQWVPTFLAPALVGVLLANVPIRPPLKVAAGLLVIVTVSALIASSLATALLPSPLILFGGAVLIVFRSLYGIAAGKSPVVALFLLICVTAIPVIAMESPAVASAFASALIRATCLAIVIVWTAYLLWPQVRPPRPAAKAPPLPADLRLKSALIGTAIMAPLMLVYLLFGLTNALPVLIATAMIVMSLDIRGGRMQAVALVAGNVAGGIVALAVFVVLQMESSLMSLTLLTALVGLAYGWRISAGDRMAPVVLVACNATLIVLSSSLMSDQGSFTVWVTRLTQFVLAGAFAVGMMALLWPRNAENAARLPA